MFSSSKLVNVELPTIGLFEILQFVLNAINVTYLFQDGSCPKSLSPQLAAKLAKSGHQCGNAIAVIANAIDTIDDRSKPMCFDAEKLANQPRAKRIEMLAKMYITMFIMIVGY